VVNSANAATVKKVDAALRTGKTFELKVKGSKSTSKKLLKTLQHKIQDYNGYDVLPDFNDTSICGKDNKVDYTAMKYTASTDGAYGVYTVDKLASKEYVSALRYFKKMAAKSDNYQGLCTIDKVNLLTYIGSPYNDNIMTYDMSHKGSIAYLKYGDNKLEKYEIYDQLYNETAAGVCSDFAQACNMILDNLEITRATVSSMAANHEILVSIIKNSNGSYVFISSSNGIPTYMVIDTGVSPNRIRSLSIDRTKKGYGSISKEMTPDVKEVLGSYYDLIPTAALSSELDNYDPYK
jgi:hypothetical protein